MLQQLLILCGLGICVDLQDTFGADTANDVVQFAWIRALQSDGLRPHLHQVGHVVKVFVDGGDPLRAVTLAAFPPSLANTEHWDIQSAEHTFKVLQHVRLTGAHDQLMYGINLL